jgi:DNA topoisomerase-1
MTKSLVIVESPAKAKTIGKYLGDDFDVRASVGHIADLPSKGLAVDVENSFKPNYELTERGKDRIRELKAALKDADELYLATDEDREGEAIAAHLVEYLNPRVPVKRMVFHEITKAAIESALASPRQVNTTLVDAAEARRILDRLFGYELSPILWRKVNRGLSAGRVQSPAIRLVVEREEQRRLHRRTPYWDLEAVTATSPSFTAALVAVDGRRVATGKDFDLDGTVNKDVVVVGAELATGLADGLAGAALAVRSVESRPYRKSPKAPFMTSTLQQEGGNKLRMSASEVMRVAQGLYEGGYITYMRTDAVILGVEAMAEVRGQIASSFGTPYLSEQERTYKSKVKNAQEAHEAIRPSLPLRSPEQLAGELHSNELALYRLIWQRTLASQMVDATGTTLTVRLGAQSAGHDCEFSASGTTILFPGYQQAYEESVEDEADDENAGDARMPVLAVGDDVALQSVEPKGHETQPPARYTEATLVKKLEEEGIGRPSTYASIIGTIINRGYVWKKGQALVPSWTSFAVVKLLTTYFPSLVDYKFTANLNNELDEIAEGTRNRNAWLAAFYFGGDGHEGLKPLVEHNREIIDAALLNSFPLGDHPTTGEPVIVRPGKYGPYVRSGEHTASVPESMAPDELTLDVAVALLAAPKMDDPIGDWNGHPVFVKTGRYGPYVQWGTMDEPPAGMEKPRMESLLSTMSVETVTLDDALKLLSLPRQVGADPADGEPILVRNGRYGPYVQKGTESRSLDGEDQLFTLTLDEALAKLAQPRTYGRRGPAKPPLKEFGTDPVSGKPVVAKDGRFGTYVTDGDTNASLTRGDRLEFMTAERAFELLAIRREAEPSTKKKVGARKAAAPRAAAKKSAAKKAAPGKKAPAKKAAAKKSATATKTGAARAAAAATDASDQPA